MTKAVKQILLLLKEKVKKCLAWQIQSIIDDNSRCFYNHFRDFWDFIWTLNRLFSASVQLPHNSQIIVAGRFRVWSTRGWTTRGDRARFSAWQDLHVTAERISPSLNHYDCSRCFLFSFFSTHHSVWKKPGLQKYCYLTSHLCLMGPNLNYYVLVVSWCYYKYLMGSVYHRVTLYQHWWISCACKGQWFACKSMIR